MIPFPEFGENSAGNSFQDERALKSRVERLHIVNALATFSQARP